MGIDWDRRKRTYNRDHKTAYICVQSLVADLYAKLGAIDRVAREIYVSGPTLRRAMIRWGLKINPSGGLRENTKKKDIMDFLEAK